MKVTESYVLFIMTRFYSLIPCFPAIQGRRGTSHQTLMTCFEYIFVPTNTFRNVVFKAFFVYGSSVASMTPKLNLVKSSRAAIQTYRTLPTLHQFLEFRKTFITHKVLSQAFDDSPSGVSSLLFHLLACDIHLILTFITRRPIQTTI